MAILKAVSVIQANVFKRFRFSVVQITTATSTGADDEWVGPGGHPDKPTAGAAPFTGTGMRQVFAAWVQSYGALTTRHVVVLNNQGTGAAQPSEGGAVGIESQAGTTAYLFTIGRV